MELEGKLEHEEADTAVAEAAATKRPDFFMLFGLGAAEISDSWNLLKRKEEGKGFSFLFYFLGGEKIEKKYFGRRGSCGDWGKSLTGYIYHTKGR